jgi:hypothetical protein
VYFPHVHDGLLSSTWYGSSWRDGGWVESNNNSKKKKFSNMHGSNEGEMIPQYPQQLPLSSLLFHMYNNISNNIVSTSTYMCLIHLLAGNLWCRTKTRKAPAIVLRHTLVNLLQSLRIHHLRRLTDVFAYT